MVNGTIEHEEELRNRRTRRKIKANEVPVDDSFRHIHGKECRCINGTTCQICVTDQDLMGVPKRYFKTVDRRSGPITDTLIVQNAPPRSDIFRVHVNLNPILV